MSSLSAPSYTLIDNNTLSIDTVHLVCYHYFDKSVWSKWMVGKRSERINSVITDIGERIIAMNKFEKTNHNCRDKAVLDVLSYYQIKRS